MPYELGLANLSIGGVRLTDGSLAFGSFCLMRRIYGPRCIGRCRFGAMLDDLKGELAAAEVDSTIPGTTYAPLLSSKRQLSAGERQDMLAMVQGTRRRAEAASGVAGHAPSMHSGSFVGSSSRAGSEDEGEESLREARVSMYVRTPLDRGCATDRWLFGIWVVLFGARVAGMGRCLTI